MSFRILRHSSNKKLKIKERRRIRTMNSKIPLGNLSILS